VIAVRPEIVLSRATNERSFLPTVCAGSDCGAQHRDGGDGGKAAMASNVCWNSAQGTMTSAMLCMTYCPTGGDIWLRLMGLASLMRDLSPADIECRKAA